MCANNGDVWDWFGSWSRLWWWLEFLEGFLKLAKSYHEIVKKRWFLDYLILDSFKLFWNCFLAYWVSFQTSQNFALLAADVNWAITSKQLLTLERKTRILDQNGISSISGRPLRYISPQIAFNSTHRERIEIWLMNQHRQLTSTSDHLEENVG